MVYDEMLETETKNGKVLELQADAVGVLPDTKDDKPLAEEAGEVKSLLKIRLILVIFGISSLLPWNTILNAAGSVPYK